MGRRHDPFFEAAKAVGSRFKLSNEFDTAVRLDLVFHAQAPVSPVDDHAASTGRGQIG